MEQENGPMFHCPTCVRPERDVELGCPRCPLTRRMDSLREAVRREVVKRHAQSRLYPRWDIGVSYPEAMEAYELACSALETTGDRIDGRWDETLAAMVSVVLGERAQARAVDEFNSRRT